MLAILGGLGAAVAWATSGLCSSRSSRMVGSPAVVAWMMLVGIVVIAPVTLAEGVPVRLHGATLGWLVLAGAGNIAGLLVAYVAYRSGEVVLIAPITSSEGAIAAVIAVARGERLELASAITLAVIAAGVTLAAVPPSASRERRARHRPRVVALAVLAAVCFGVSLYATGHVSSLLPLAWVVLSARALGTVFVAAPLALRGRLRLTRRAAPLVAVSGLCEVAGFSSFYVGARHDLAVAAVLSCQFAAIAAVVAWTLFRERLGGVQLAGVVVLLVGVSVLSGLRG